jgi:hypothetical protein
METHKTVIRLYILLKKLFYDFIYLDRMSLSARIFLSTKFRPALVHHRNLSTQKDFGLNNHFYYRESPLMNKIDKNEQIPLVLVLGWAGAIDKHVLKYAQIYEKMGYHTIRLSPTVGMSVFKPHLHKDYAMKLLDLIKSKAHLKNSPIVIHTFSNAGTFIYRHVSDTLNESNNEHSYLKTNVKVMIYDSGPVK